MIMSYTLKKALNDIGKKYRNTDFARNVYIVETKENYSYDINNIKEFSLPFDNLTILAKDEINYGIFKVVQNNPEKITAISKVNEKDMFKFVYIYNENGIEMKCLQIEKIMGMYATEDNMNNLGKTILSLILNLIKDLSSKNILKGKFERSSKMSSGSYKYLNVTYITDKRYLSRDIKSFTMGKINWSHSFRVCGHWRKTKGIGKNRDGIRCIDNYTWIVPYEKNKELEKIDKLRVVR